MKNTEVLRPISILRQRNKLSSTPEHPVQIIHVTNNDLYDYQTATKYSYFVLPFPQTTDSFITQSAPFIVSCKTAVSCNCKTAAIVLRGSTGRSRKYESIVIQVPN
jgi:hypothetical protein